MGGGGGCGGRGGCRCPDWLRARAAAGQDVGPVATGRPTPRKRALGRARVVQADPVVVEQLARIGNNLNQLVGGQHRTPGRWMSRRCMGGAAVGGLRDAVVAGRQPEPATTGEVEVVVDLVDGDDQDHQCCG